MAPLLLTPLERYPAALFWDSHVSTCDRGMNGPFFSAGFKGGLQPPSETPRKRAVSYTESNSALETQLSFKADVKSHLNYQNEESNLKQVTVQSSSNQQHSSVKAGNSS